MTYSSSFGGNLDGQEDLPNTQHNLDPSPPIDVPPTQPPHMPGSDSHDANPSHPPSDRA